MKYVLLSSYPLLLNVGWLPEQLFIGRLHPQPIPLADQSAAQIKYVLLGSYPLLLNVGRLPEQLFIGQLPPQPIPLADQLAAK